MAEEIKKQNMPKLIDSHGRIVDYLRISLTDRCNLKCMYCHPPHKIDYLNRSEICSYGELLQIAKIAAGLGIEKIRITGGELFLRKEAVGFIQSLNNIKGLREIALTTNGTLLLPHLKRLKEIGLKRINVSLDTLSEDLFSNITGSQRFYSVLKAIHAALEEGFEIKVNMVVLNGINDGEINRFIDYFLKRSIEVRFIEFMPLCGSRWRGDYFYSYEKIKETIKMKYDLHSLPSLGVAQEFAVGNGKGFIGRVGIIAPVTREFCSSCSRLRLSANGELWPCLFSMRKVNLLPILRSASTYKQKEEMIAQSFKQAVRMKALSKSVNKDTNELYIRSLGG